MPCGDHDAHMAGCQLCARYKRVYAQRRTAAIAAGTWQYRQPVGPVRAHLRDLRRAPMTARAISRTSGVGYTTVLDILRPHRATQPGSRNQARRYVAGPVAVALLAVQAAPHGPHGQLPVLTSSRQLQALAVIGFSDAMSATAAGISKSAVWKIANGWQDWVKPKVADRIRDAFDRGCAALEAAAPATIVAGGDPTTATAAIAKGWHGPLAWDEDTIGDPAAVAATDAPRPPRSTVSSTVIDDALRGRTTYLALTTAERVVVTRILLYQRQLTHEQIGALLGWSATAVCAFCSAHGLRSPRLNGTRGRDAGTRNVDRLQLAE